MYKELLRHLKRPSLHRLFRRETSPSRHPDRYIDSRPVKCEVIKVSDILKHDKGRTDTARSKPARRTVVVDFSPPRDRPPTPKTVNKSALRVGFSDDDRKDWPVALHHGRGESPIRFRCVRPPLCMATRAGFTIHRRSVISINCLWPTDLHNNRTRRLQRDLIAIRSNYFNRLNTVDSTALLPATATREEFCERSKRDTTVARPWIQEARESTHRNVIVPEPRGDAFESVLGSL